MRLSIKQRAENFYYQKILRPLLFSSRLGRRVILGRVGKSSFVDYIYQNESSGYTKIGRIIDRLLLRLPATTATREKGEKIYSILESVVVKNVQANQTSRIVDLGSGTAPYLRRLIKDSSYNDQVQAVCLDIDKHALNYAKRLVSGAPIQYRLGNVTRLERYGHLSRKVGWSPNAAVVSTLYEFLKDGEVRKSIEDLYDNLSSGGTAIIVSQSRNPQHKLIEHLSHAHKSPTLHYRSSSIIKKWLIEAGFKDIDIQRDRWGMYYFYTAKKTGKNFSSQEISPIFLKSASYKRASEQRTGNLYQYMRGFKPLRSGKVLKGNQKIVMMATNDYLGLRMRREVVKAAIKALQTYGTSTTSSRILTGNLEIHEELQAKLARFLDVEDALTFSTGYTANLGVVTSLLEEGDIAFVDRNSHASMLDGCKLAGGEARFFAHNSTEQLEKLLEEYKETHNKLIMCDGVYSMDGDLAPLPQICELGKRYGAGMAIDDGHATGVFGGTGRGTLQHFSLDGKGCLIIGSLAKALASVGGFVAGDHIVIDHLRHTARPLIFSTALSPIHTAIALEALKIIEREPHLREKLWSNAERMKQTLLALGFNIGNSVSPLIPIIVGDEATTYKMVLELEELGVVVDGVGYPGVKKNQCRLRIRMMATHSEQDIEIALKHLKRIGQKYKVV